MNIDHPNVRNVYQENIFEDGQWKRRVVVETTLNVDASDPRYKATDVDELQNVIVDWMKKFTTLIDSVVVRTWVED